ncbi:MAG: putative toxin-antitoxin system toxin component, PIN family [Fibromonadaceae bacterium]|jgi:putative PIN family toxin of toxin-antitoxin system|nr:putative toxin-antitoxin system toxin component, PIN family [Fibromonadaceae bacterium]
MIKVVFDTNILVSAFKSEKGNPAKALFLFAKRKIDAFYSDNIYAEYEEVLNRAHFNFREQEVSRTLEGFKRFGKLFAEDFG